MSFLDAISIMVLVYNNEGRGAIEGAHKTWG